MTEECVFLNEDQFERAFLLSISSSLLFFFLFLSLLANCTSSCSCFFYIIIGIRIELITICRPGGARFPALWGRGGALPAFYSFLRFPAWVHNSSRGSSRDAMLRSGAFHWNEQDAACLFALEATVQQPYVLISGRWSGQTYGVLFKHWGSALRRLIIILLYYYCFVFSLYFVLLRHL